MAGIAIDLRLAEICLDQLARAQLDEVVVKACAGLSAEPMFGVGSVSGEVVAARDAYCEVAEAFLNNLPIHRDNVRTLVRWLESAIAEYGGVDEAQAAEIRSRAQEPRIVRAIDTSFETTHATTLSGGETAGHAPPLRLADTPNGMHREAPFNTAYLAYNVPRYAGAFSHEGGNEAGEPARNLSVIASSLTDHFDQLNRLRDKIAFAWSPQKSEAAARYLEAIDRHIRAVHVDIEVAEKVAKALDSIMETLVRTKHEMGYLEEQWNRVTTDWIPEFWDHTAQELNTKAAERMEMTDAIVRDQRSGIVATLQANLLGHEMSPSKPPPAGDPQDRAGGGAASGSFGVSGSPGPSAPSGGTSGFSVPPVPGFNPAQGPVLAGGPMPVPLSASNPPSMLPIPPGVNSLVPQGGAWLLPGPGVGAQGRLVPMSRPGSGGVSAVGGAVRGDVMSSAMRANVGFGGAAAAGAGAALVGAAGGGAGAAQVGAAGGGPARGAAAGGENVKPGAGREKWEVRRGVSPVIDNPENLENEDASTDRAIEDHLGFEAWFAKTATPWISEVA